MAPNPRHMEARLARAARDADVELDMNLTCVQRHGAGYRVVASAATFPESEEARWYMQTALHVLVLDEFSEVPPDHLDVQVVVPHALPTPPAELPTHQFVTEQVLAKTDYSFLFLVTTARAAYTRVVDSYPWRDAEAMHARIPALMHRILRNLAAQHTDPALHGNVDAILPPLEGLLAPLDREHVAHEVARRLGRPPKTLLELYETVFCLARNNSPDMSVRALAHLLLA